MRTHLPTRLFAAVLLALFVIGCDSNDDEKGSIEGLWELRGADEFYVEITDDEINLYDYQGDSVDQGEDCYAIQFFDITDKDGDTYELDNETELEITRDDDELRVDDGDEVLRFNRSDEDVDDFEPACTLSKGAPKL